MRLLHRLRSAISVRQEIQNYREFPTHSAHLFTTLQIVNDELS
jgi:hypothetical protein